jgi:hypothetical protein
MTQLTLTIPDSQSAFIMKVLKAFDYVKVEKKVKIQDPPLSVEHKRILDGISEAVEEINLHKKGIKKMQSGDDFLEELRREGYL